MIDFVWIALALALGLIARIASLPPLVGFLVAGFVLAALDYQGGETLQEFSDLGITLLLFTIGLKLRVRTLLRPQIWGVATVHMVLVSVLLAGALLVAAATGVSLLQGGLAPALVLGFALSFSSTVFGMKVLEARGEVSSVYGSTVIGILIVQDIAAVVFLAATTGKIPSPWALAIIPGLVPLQWLLWRLLNRVGHGELMVLFGLAAALGGSLLFELAGLKGDLGALVFGVLLASHRSADELAKSLFAFKDLFLLGFFLSVGLQGIPSPEVVLIALGLLAFLPLKSGLYLWLLTRFRMRARTSLLAALGLANYSEFGLIVASLASARGWISPDWLTVMALALALSFVAASPINERAFGVYRRFRDRLLKLEKDNRRPEEEPIEVGQAEALVFGMGRVGTGAYDELRSAGFKHVVGIDSAEEAVGEHARLGRTVIRASGTDLDFWDRLQFRTPQVRLVLLTLPKVEENEFAARQLIRKNYPGRIAALAKYPDDAARLRRAGVHRVFNLYQEAGAGLAIDALTDPETP